MKCCVRLLSRVLLAAFVLFAVTSPATDGKRIHAQESVSLPTQIFIESTPAYLTIIETGGTAADTGDFNADGVDDLLIQYLGTESRKAGIIFGNRNLNPPVKINLSTAPPDLTLNIALAGASEAAISSPGDLNGDGVDDLVLTVTGPSANRTLYVFFGSADLRPGTLDLNLLRPNLTIISSAQIPAPRITTVADVNGDGARDLLLSNSFNPVFIMLGPVADGGVIDFRTQSPDIVISARAFTESLRSSVAADVNGDGIADILIVRSGLIFNFAPFMSLDIVLGAAGLRAGSEIDLSAGQADAAVGVGGSVLAAGDVNGDGIDDIISGAPAYSGEPAPPPWWLGSVEIFFGSRSLRKGERMGVAGISGLPPPFPFERQPGLSLGDRLGQSLAVGDVNGDRIGDILVGAPGSALKKDRIVPFGRAYVVLGSDELKDRTGVHTSLHQQDVTIRAQSDEGTTGQRVEGGDFNGDSVSDILVESYFDSGSAIHIYLGGQLAPPVITKAKYRKDANELIIFGADFTGAAQVEINGVIVAREIEFDSEKGRLTLAGNRRDLNLNPGKNQIVVIRKGARSNTFKLKL